MKEKIYDYATGLDAPYWIQQVWIGRKNKRKLLWTFTVPMQLSYFVVFSLVLGVMLLYLGPVLEVLNEWTHSLSLLLYIYLPTKLAKLYVEAEPQGKKMIIYLFDYVRYFFAFVLNKKAIYHDERVDTYDDDEIVFEKTNL